MTMADDHQIWIDIAQHYFGSFQGKRLLVVGSGTGGLEAAFLSSASGEDIPRLVSLDHDWTMVLSTAQVMRSTAAGDRSSCLHADGHCLPLRNDCGDVVFCIAVLEHVQNYKTFTREILRVLKLGGYLFVYYGPNAKIPLDSPYHRRQVTRYLTPEQVRHILQPCLCWIKPVWAEVVEYRLNRNTFQVSKRTPFHIMVTVLLTLASLPIFRRTFIQVCGWLEHVNLQHGIAFVGQKYEL